MAKEQTLPKQKAEEQFLSISTKDLDVLLKFVTLLVDNDEFTMGFIDTIKSLSPLVTPFIRSIIFYDIINHVLGFQLEDFFEEEENIGEKNINILKGLPEEQLNEVKKTWEQLRVMQIRRNWFAENDIKGVNDKLKFYSKWRLIVKPNGYVRKVARDKKLNPKILKIYLDKLLKIVQHTNPNL